MFELLIVVAALVLTIKAGYQQDRFEETLEKRLKQLNQSFEKVDSALVDMPVRINKFSLAIGSLSKIANQQKTELHVALKNLGISVSRFDSSLESYGSVFRRLAEVNKGQIELLEK